MKTTLEIDKVHDTWQVRLSADVVGLICYGSGKTQDEAKADFLINVTNLRNQLNGIVESDGFRSVMVRNMQLELLAAAFCKQEKIEPSQAELVEETKGTSIVWHFRRRK